MNLLGGCWVFNLVVIPIIQSFGVPLVVEVFGTVKAVINSTQVIMAVIMSSGIMTLIMCVIITVVMTVIMWASMPVIMTT